jgi:hypothetical protein
MQHHVYAGLLKYGAKGPHVLLSVMAGADVESRVMKSYEFPDGVRTFQIGTDPFLKCWRGWVAI